MADRPPGTPPEIIGALETGPLTELLIRTNGLHEGIYELSVSFDVTGGLFGFNQKPPLPGIACVLNAIGLTRLAEPNDRSVNAAVINPAPAAKVKSPARKPKKT